MSKIHDIIPIFISKKRVKGHITKDNKGKIKQYKVRHRKVKRNLA